MQAGNQSFVTEVFAVPAAYNTVGQGTPGAASTVVLRGPASSSRGLIKLDEYIKPRLAQRLVNYASRSMADAGFGAMTVGWQISVYTIDGDAQPSDRSYCVRWQNEKGGYIEVIGILTHSGWPSIDHGFGIGQE